jgi:hypothetical protein
MRTINHTRAPDADSPRAGSPVVSLTTFAAHYISVEPQGMLAINVTPLRYCSLREAMFGLWRELPTVESPSSVPCVSIPESVRLRSAQTDQVRPLCRVPNGS